MRSLRFVADGTDADNAIVAAAASRLSHILSQGDASDWTCEVRSVSQGGEVSPAPADAIHVVSLAPWLDDPRAPWADTAAAITERVEYLSRQGARVVLVTVLRHVSPGAFPDFDHALLVRIRRLNLLAVELSNDLGVCVADLDRDLADIGARTLGTDYRLTSPAARDAAAWSLLRCVAANALDGLVDFRLQEKVLAAGNAARPQIDPVARVLDGHVVRVGYGRRTQIVSPASRTGGGRARQVLMRALKFQIGLGEVQSYLAGSIREGRFWDDMRKVLDELLRLTSRGRA